MTAWVRAAAIGMIAAAAPVGLVGVVPVAGQVPTERLTTDTPEYCSELVARLRQSAQARPAAREVAALSGEGELMCAHGETRRGILRLRRAMRLLLGGAEAQ